MLAWSFVETMGGGGLNLTETLSCIAPSSLEATTLWSSSSSPAEGSVPPAHFGAERAVDVAAGVLYTQSENQSVGRFDLRTKQPMPRLVTGGARFACLHYDPAERRLGGIAVPSRDPGSRPGGGGGGGGLALVSIDTTTGEVTTRLQMPDFPAAAGGLALFYLDRSVSPGDSFSPVSRPACTFDPGTGALAFLLVDEDTAVKPAYASRAL